MLRSKPGSHPWFHSTAVSSHSLQSESSDLLHASISTSRAGFPAGVGSRVCHRVSVHSRQNTTQQMMSITALNINVNIQIDRQTAESAVLCTSCSA